MGSEAAGRGIADRAQRGSGRSAAPGDVDQPRGPEPVDAHPELVAPRLGGQLNRHCPSVRQRMPVAAQFLGVVPAEADREVVPGPQRLARQHVGGHQREARRCFQLAVQTWSPMPWSSVSKSPK